MPILFYFQGAGSGRATLDLAKVSHSLTRSTLVVAPVRPTGKWWVLGTDVWDAWVTEGLDEPVLVALRTLCEGVFDLDEVDRVHGASFMGYSAGGFAVAEVLSGWDPRRTVWAVVLAATHPHGQHPRGPWDL